METLICCTMKTLRVRPHSILWMRVNKGTGHVSCNWDKLQATRIWERWQQGRGTASRRKGISITPQHLLYLNLWVKEKLLVPSGSLGRDSWCLLNPQERIATMSHAHGPWRKPTFTSFEVISLSLIFTGLYCYFYI